MLDLRFGLLVVLWPQGALQGRAPPPTLVSSDFKASAERPLASSAGCMVPLAPSGVPRTMLPSHSLPSVVVRSALLRTCSQESRRPRAEPWKCLGRCHRGPVPSDSEPHGASLPRSIRVAPGARPQSGWGGAATPSASSSSPPRRRPATRPTPRRRCGAGRRRSGCPRGSRSSSLAGTRRARRIGSVGGAGSELLVHGVTSGCVSSRRLGRCLGARMGPERTDKRQDTSALVDIVADGGAPSAVHCALRGSCMPILLI